ncbi:MAG: LTA synthase family protein, partial [Bacteroidales bacterium]|nr:LTA synthase family protein [Bacteroidales bacterium]
MKSWLLSRNILVVLIYRILLILFLFSLCRVGFYVFNLKMFPGITPGQFLEIMRGGLLFDISATVYINLLIILLHVVPFEFRYNDLYQKILKYIFFLTNGLALAVNCADFVYYRFVFKRATADVFRTFENESHLAKMLFRYLVDYWPATLFGLLTLFLMVFLYLKIKVRKPEPSGKVLYHVINILAVPLAIGLCIGGARGSMNESTRPIAISNAARYVDNPRDVAIVLNTPFSLLRT